MFTSIHAYSQFIDTFAEVDEPKQKIFSPREEFSFKAQEVLAGGSVPIILPIRPLVSRTPPPCSLIALSPLFDTLDAQLKNALPSLEEILSLPEGEAVLDLVPRVSLQQIDSECNLKLPHICKLIGAKVEDYSPCQAVENALSYLQEHCRVDGDDVDTHGELTEGVDASNTYATLALLVDHLCNKDGAADVSSLRVDSPVNLNFVSSPLSRQRSDCDGDSGDDEIDREATVKSIDMRTSIARDADDIVSEASVEAAEVSLSVSRTDDSAPPVLQRSMESAKRKFASHDSLVSSADSDVTYLPPDLKQRRVT
jgi:hypothetical protein